MRVADHVRGESNFIYYRGGNCWYQTADTNFAFPVPIEDVEGATLDAHMRSAMLMRWIKKYIDKLKEAADARKDLKEQTPG